METKDVVSFAIGSLDQGHPSVLSVTPLINGLSLKVLVADFEQAHGYEPVGGYGGIVPQWFDYGPIEKYFLGDHATDGYWADIGGIYLLGCECGEVGCWPLQCVVRHDGDVVVWQDFHQPHRRSRNYSNFGPFAFDVSQYRNALAKLLAGIANWNDTL